MKAHFDIAVEPARDLVRMTLFGFFTPADIALFVQARKDALRRLRCGPNEHVTLVDIACMDIQSQEAVVAFQATINDPAMACRRLAIILAEKSLCRMQMRRAAADRDAHYFATITEAEAFLLDPAAGTLFNIGATTP